MKKILQGKISFKHDCLNIAFTFIPIWNLKESSIDLLQNGKTSENITIYTLLCKDTIDERIHNLVEQKGIMADAIVDGKIRTSKSDLLDYLLN